MAITRTEDEVVSAHDLMAAVLTGEIDLDLTEGQQSVMAAAADVLCWLLGHEHNQSFAKNLAELAKEVEEAGYVMRAVN